MIILNNDLRLSKVLQILVLAIILILISLNISQFSLLLLLIPINFALIGTVSSLTNSIVSLVITFLVLIYFANPTQAMDIFINSVVPGTIIGIIAKKVIKQKDSNKYQPIFTGSIVFIISMIIYYFISKYVFKIDLLNTFLQLVGQSLESQKSLILNGSNKLLNSQDILDNMRNLMPSILFFRGITLSIIIYLIEIFILRKMKYDGLSEIKFKNFYLPGNAILASLVLYLLIMGISYMKTPLYTDAIFLNLQIVFDFMFVIQGIAVSIYFIRKWLEQRTNKKLFIGALCIGIFGMTCISFIGMIDSILDFRKIREYKSM